MTAGPRALFDRLDAGPFRATTAAAGPWDPRYRLPVGEWVCLDAVTRLGPSGTGVAESLLFDEQGLIGRAVQTLLVTPA